MHIVEESKDRELWRLAKKRAAFQKHLRTYIIMSIFFWIIWYFTAPDYYGGLPWPGWAMLGWGIGLLFNYFDAYHGSMDTAVEREYQKLKNEKNQ